MRTRRNWMGLLVLVMVAAGCGGDDSETTAGNDAATTTAAGGSAPSSTTTSAATPALELASSPLGEILVDGDGRTLYLFTKDEGGESRCVADCAELWPPVEAPAEPTVGEGLDESLVATTTREDGSSQLTYGGSPLYRYTPDESPGDTTGQGVGGV